MSHGGALAGRRQKPQQCSQREYKQQCQQQLSKAAQLLPKPWSCTEPAVGERQCKGVRDWGKVVFSLRLEEDPTVRQRPAAQSLRATSSC